MNNSEVDNLTPHLMDSDSCTREQNQKGDSQESNDGPKQKIIGNRKLNGRNVFSTVWIRRAFYDHNEIDKFLLDYGFYFLLPVGSLLYTTFFILA